MLKFLKLHRIHCFFLVLITLMTLIAFRPFFFEGKIPIPGDILLGSYHPWMDQRWENRSTIYPVLNNEISDSMTSFYPWRYKAVSLAKSGIFPLLDESSYLGFPLLASGQTGFLYPLNIISFLLPFNFAWGILVSLTPLLSALFFYLWLKEKRLHPSAIIITSLTYAFSAFLSLQVTFVSTAHSVLWLPLMLYCIDKLLLSFRIKYFLLIIFAVFSSVNSGFFQGSLYILLFSFTYLIFHAVRSSQQRQAFLIAVGFGAGLALSAIQILPFAELVSQSSRAGNYGHSALLTQTFNFFVEYKYLLTTLIPDFFGNPGRWNYWGKPNYYEFNNYVGYLSLLGLGLVLLNSKLRRKLSFFLGALLFSLILATPNPLSQFPYLHNWPILSSLTPSRILVITQFCLITVSAFGLSELFFRRISLRKVLTPMLFLTTVYAVSIIFTYLGSIGVNPGQWSIAFRNTTYSSLIAVTSFLIILLLQKFPHRIFIVTLLTITAFDLLKQSSFHRPFIKPELIYPQEKIVSFLQQNSSGYRFSITSPDLFPSNLQSIFGLQAVDGVGPLFPDRFNLFIASANRDKLTNPLPRYPYSIFYENPHQPLLSLLNVKYILSIKEINNPALKKVNQDNQTIVYENTKVLPRAWIAPRTLTINDPFKTMQHLKSADFNPTAEAVLNEEIPLSPFLTPPNSPNPQITKAVFGEGKADFETAGSGLLVFSEQFLPGWQGSLDGQTVKIHRVDFDLIGVVLPPGPHKVSLFYQPTSFLLGFKISLITLTLVLLWRQRAVRAGK